MEENNNTQAQQPRFEVDIPVEQYDLTYVGAAWHGAYIEFVPFTGFDVDEMEGAGQAEAVHNLYKNVARSITGGKIPAKGGEMVELTKDNFRAIPHKYLLKFYQYAVNGDVSENLGN